MKKLFVSLILLLPLGLVAQNPACTQKGSLTTATTFTALTNNTANPTCNAFALTWTSTGFTAISFQLQGADTLAGTYTAFSGTSTVIVGSNPATSLSGAIVVQASAKLAFLQVKLNSVTGSGTVNFQLYGYNGVTAAVASVGGGAPCGALGGDLSGSCAAATVVGVNGATVPLSAPVVASNGSRQLIAATMTGTGSTAVLSASPAFSGSPTAPTQTPGDNTTALATDAFVQAAINAFSVPFSLISGGTNTTATMNCGTGCFMTFGGSGAINANQINGTAIATANTPVLATNGGDQIVAATRAGAGTVVAMTTALGAAGNCANWNANGVGDSGSPCPGGSGGGGGVVTYSGPTLSLLSGTAYCPVGGGGACSATETNVDIDSPATATVSKLYVQLSQALGAGNSVAVTWRANASSQTVTCTISGAVATSCNDTTHSFTATTGDLLTYQLIFAGTIIVTPTITIASAFGTSNVGVTSVSGTAPVTSTGGTTPVIACATCVTGTPTNHGPMIGSATQAATYSSAGTAGQVYTSNGASADPTFQAASGAVTSVGGLTGAVPGGLIFLERHTASNSAELDFTCPSSAYDDYEIDVMQLQPTTNAVHIILQFSSNGGTTWDTTSNYVWAAFRFTNSASAAAGSSAASGININGGSTQVNSSGSSAWLRLHQPLSSAVNKQLIGTTVGTDSTGYGSTMFGAYPVSGTTSINAFRVLADSGTLASGIVSCYGVAKQ